MKKFYAFAAASLLCVSGAIAQTSGFERCSAMEVLHQQMQNDPKMESRMQAIEAHTQKFLQNKSTTANQRTNAVVTIPVVVHVVWNTASQNITDCQIQSQLAVLNEDFRKLNADNSKTPALYAGLAADAQIQFVLATKDPNGNATTGITRTKTKTRTFSGNNAIKFTSQGGKDAWNTSQYLNFWIAPNLVDRGVQLLGYGQFPGGPASTDGVVMAYGAFGSRAKCPSGVYYQGYDLGRTTTHEVGHFLNLRHIWGDATCGNDLVSDTPTQQTSNYGCPTFPKITCSNQGDMSMNFMDYTDDPCMYMFTTGQAARMAAVLAPGGFHYSLTTSTAASTPVATTTTSTQGATTTASRDMNFAAATVFPNPVKAEMNVSYSVTAENTNVEVEIYNLLGALVGTYKEGAKPAGKHVFSINSDNSRSFGALSNGMYFCRINGAEEGKLVRFVIER
ncbi:T9SS type A sorting domain-containing protein [Adhaeribacter sp. BT258]|uniref:T9SS type A sorting domain-containing protein n=1 Tax=Adhaeribacter terrigena TaxID=2793070 RepID=A0ABS1C3Q1_9BACT|nr:M43 family zinc metalloprotease [Adhaeribacter terrigena]MBK0404019.1 T9SS type A sorting domain-containing protein [Adhaeribacter terrigena]